MTEYVNRSGEDVQVSIPGSNPVQWIVIKENEKKDLPISESRAALNGLYTLAKLKELAEETKVEEDKQVKAEESSIGHMKVKTKKIAEETQGSKDLPGIPNDITGEEAKKADSEFEEKSKKKSSKKKSKK